MSREFDLVILGSGTTAFAGALKASELGAKVLMVEQSQLGGTCVNWGCIPSKTLIDKAEARFGARRYRGMGIGLKLKAPIAAASWRSRRKRWKPSVTRATRRF